MNEDSHLEEAYEDQFYIDDTDCDDGYTWGWEGYGDTDYEPNPYDGTYSED